MSQNGPYSGHAVVGGVELRRAVRGAGRPVGRRTATAASPDPAWGAPSDRRCPAIATPPVGLSVPPTGAPRHRRRRRLAAAAAAAAEAAEHPDHRAGGGARPADLRRPGHHRLAAAAADDDDRPRPQRSPTVHRATAGGDPGPQPQPARTPGSSPRASACATRAPTDEPEMRKIVPAPAAPTRCSGGSTGRTTGEEDAEAKCAKVPGYTKWYFYDSSWTASTSCSASASTRPRLALSSAYARSG